MQRELSTDNLKLAIKDKHTLETAQDMLVNRRYNELEELLRIEWMDTQERAIVLNKMYLELTKKNISLTDSDNEEYCIY